MKICAKCKEEKSAECFSVSKRSKDGLDRLCRTCTSIVNKASRTRNKEKIKVRNSIKYANNKEKIKAKSAKYYAENRDVALERRKEYRDKNKHKLAKCSKEGQKKRYHSDPLYRTSRKIQAKVRIAVARGGYSMRSSVYSILSCSWDTFKAHIENQFKDGMSWSNRSDWHIDHKVPLSAACNEEEMVRLWNYKNLQPLWPEENKFKGSKLFPQYLKEALYLPAHI